MQDITDHRASSSRSSRAFDQSTRSSNKSQSRNRSLDRADRCKAKINIYIADDQPLIRKGLKSLLNGEPDMRVCGEAPDRARASREVRRLVPDVVIMELDLRVENTIGLIQQFHGLNQSVHVVVFSRHDEELYAIPAFKAGARAFVMKHESPGVVIEAVRKVVQGQMHFSGAVHSQLLDGFATRRFERNESSLAALSPREIEVVTLIGAGMTSREIASRLDVSIKTIEAHRAHIKQKANLDNGTALMRYSMAMTSDFDVLPV